MNAIPFLMASSSFFNWAILSLKNFSLRSVNSFSIFSMFPKVSCFFLLPSLSSLLLLFPFAFFSLFSGCCSCSGPLSDRSLLSFGVLLYSFSLLSLLLPEFMEVFLLCLVFNLLVLRVSSLALREASSPLDNASVKRGL